MNINSRDFMGIEKGQFFYHQYIVGGEQVGPDHVQIVGTSGIKMGKLSWLDLIGHNGNNA